MYEPETRTNMSQEPLYRVQGVGVRVNEAKTRTDSPTTCGSVCRDHVGTRLYKPETLQGSGFTNQKSCRNQSLRTRNPVGIKVCESETP